MRSPFDVNFEWNFFFKPHLPTNHGFRWLFSTVKLRKYSWNPFTGLACGCTDNVPSTYSHPETWKILLITLLLARPSRCHNDDVDKEKVKMNFRWRENSPRARYHRKPSSGHSNRPSRSMRKHPWRCCAALPSLHRQPLDLTQR